MNLARELQRLPMQSGYIRTMVLWTVSVAIVCAVDITWDTERIARDADPSAESTSAVYTASANGGSARVRVAQLGCGCMSASRDWQTIQAGAKVPIQVVFTHGSRSGKQTKRIGVEIDADGKTTNKQLLLEVNIPEIINIDKRILSWGVGENQTQQVVLTRVAGPPMKILETRADSPLIQATIVMAEGGDRWTVTVTPQDGFVGHGRIELVTDHPFERYKRITLHAMHRTPGPDVVAQNAAPTRGINLVAWDTTKPSVALVPGIERAEAQFTVTNVTDRSVVLDRLVARGGQISTTDLPLTLAPQASQTLDVVCQVPGGSGTRVFNAEVIIKDEKVETSQQISVVVKTGERIHFATRSLAWTKKEGEYQEKRIPFESVDGTTGILAMTNDPRYTYRLVPESGGVQPDAGKPLLRGSIVIKPNPGVEPHTVIMKALTDAPDSSSKELPVRMVVQ